MSSPPTPGAGKPRKVPTAAKGLVAALAVGEPFHAGEPVCVFRAADPLVLEALELYLARSRAAGRPFESVRRMAAFVGSVEVWQSENPHLIPAPEDDP